jgi:hypothetical protein
VQLKHIAAIGVATMKLFVDELRSYYCVKFPLRHDLIKKN